MDTLDRGLAGCRGGWMARSIDGWQVALMTCWMNGLLDGCMAGEMAMNGWLDE